MRSPIKCEECNGTFLEPLADVIWSEDQGAWVAQWVNLSEGYCFHCGTDRQFVPNKEEVPRKYFKLEANERWQFTVEAETAEEAMRMVENDPYKYRMDFRGMNGFEITYEGPAKEEK